MPSNIGWIIGLLVTVIGSALAFWGNNRYFTGRFEQWREDVRERFDRIHDRIDGIEVMRDRIETNGREIDKLRELKHDIAGVQKSVSMLVDLIKHKL